MTLPETIEIVEALKTLNNPVINSIINVYEFAIEDLHAYYRVLNDYYSGDDENIEIFKSIQSGIKYRDNQVSSLIPVLRKLYNLFYVEKNSLV